MSEELIWNSFEVVRLVPHTDDVMRTFPPIFLRSKFKKETVSSELFHGGNDFLIVPMGTCKRALRMSSRRKSAYEFFRDARIAIDRDRELTPRTNTASTAVRCDVVSENTSFRMKAAG